MKEFIDKLIERLEQERKIAYNTYMNYEMNVDLGRAFGAERAIDIVNQLAEEYKVSEMPTGWIPCSERLPEKAGKYLVTINCGGAVHTTVRRFNPKPKHPKQNEPLFTKHLPLYSGWERRTCGVIAWKDLPAPYQQKGSE